MALCDPVDSPSKSPSDLPKAAVRGVFWTGSGQAIRQVLGILTSVTLARLLTPSDFGLIGMALFFVGFSHLFAEFGIGAALVQRREVTQQTFSSAFWMNLGVATLVALIVSGLAPVVSAFYDDPRVAPLVVALSVGMVVSSLIALPLAMLHRSMDFASVAKAQVVGSLIGSLAAIAAALGGMGVWSLVVQPLAGSSMTLTLMWIFARCRPSFTFAYASIRDLVHFSGGVLGSGVLNYSDRQADKLLIGKFVGTDALGYYSLAYQIMVYPLTQVTGVIVRVLFPTLSRLQDDIESFNRIYLRAVGAVAFITFPMMLGLIAVADELVVVVFGEQWLPMLPVLRVLAVVGLVQSIGTMVGVIWLATASTRLMFKVSVCASPVILCSFLIGLPFGIVGVATSYAVFAIALVYVSHYLAFRIIGLRLSQLHERVGRTLLCGAIMLGVVTMVGDWLGSGGSDVQLLAIEIFVGVVAYAIASFLFNREEATTLFTTVRGALTGRASGGG